MGVRSSVFKADKDLAYSTVLMNFGAFFCLHYISVLYFFNFEAETLIRPFLSNSMFFLPRTSDVFCSDPVRVFTDVS